jgi:hypothetical protein
MADAAGPHRGAPGCRLVLLLACLTPRPAHADEPAWAAYPQAVVARPLTLPPLFFSPFAGAAVTSATDVVDPFTSTTARATGTGTALSFGLDVGLTGRVQAGFLFTLPLDPVADFGAFTANLQLALIRDLVNVRFDVGAQRRDFRYSVMGVDTLDIVDGFVAGVGLPIKARLGRFVAITSGSSSARGFESPPLVTDGHHYKFGDSIATQDLFTVGIWPGVGTGGAVHLPIGVLVQPHPVVAFGLRSGYRLTFLSASGGTATSFVHFVPVALDVIVSIGRHVDLAATAALVGTIGGDTSRGFADVRKFDLWVVVRF